MRAFIVRPFGARKDRNGNEIDFDRVELELIGPALTRLEFTGRTTGIIMEAGNIRQDMFQELLTADLVIADVSIDNANVFWELGVRHGLRHKGTFVIRCDGDKYPFDLQTDRYFTYDRANPAAALEQLIEALRQTMASPRADSPLFLLVPKLKPQSPEDFLVVPYDFHAAVDLAQKDKQLGDLNLLCSEIKGLPWAIPGMRVVGHAQFKLKDNEGAKRTWEAVRDHVPSDTDANLFLATVYQRLWETKHLDADLTRSEQAIETVLQNKQEPANLAEAHALAARNHKARWRAEWKDLPLGEARQVAALGSGYALRTCEQYELGFDQDLNAFYPGLNAAAMLAVIIELAGKHPNAWAARFQSDEEAGAKLTDSKNRYTRLRHAVEASLMAGAQRLSQKGEHDIWLEISRADLRFLTTTDPARAAGGYRAALTGADSFTRDSVGAQLALYEDLGLWNDKVSASLSVVGSRGKPPTVDMRPRVIVFTGHQVDSPSRKRPRFPAEKEEIARNAIRKAVADEKRLADSRGIVGISGGASGGDILFHEVCQELDISTELFLALPRPEFIAASVAPAGHEWVERFNALYHRSEARILQPSEVMPRWLANKAGYGVWQRNNLWILNNALVRGGLDGDVTLIALWDGSKGDGPGGTEDMVEQARKYAKVVVLDAKALFGIA